MHFLQTKITPQHIRGFEDLSFCYYFIIFSSPPFLKRLLILEHEVKLGNVSKNDFVVIGIVSI